MAKITEACPPSDRLMKIVSRAIRTDGGECPKALAMVFMFYHFLFSDLVIQRDHLYPNGALDLDYETERRGSGMMPYQYETVYVTSHKGPCRAGAFSPDGSLVATGSVDSSIKILDVDRMIAKSNPHDHFQDPQLMERATDAHPVIRTLYDHLEEVSCLAFHPKEQFLASGSHDMTIKLFDFAKPTVKRAFKCVQDSAVVRALAFHPTGDYLLVGTQQPTIRLYHLPTFQSFISPVIADQHKGAITSLSYSNSSQLYASGSKDGEIRIWDTVSNRCVAHFPSAHEGSEVCSVAFSRNGKVSFM